jgi:hypothetical protein
MVLLTFVAITPLLLASIFLLRAAATGNRSSIFLLSLSLATWLIVFLDKGPGELLVIAVLAQIMGSVAQVSEKSTSSESPENGQ